MADGQFAGGDGTVENPFLIEDIYDLSAIRKNTSAHYKLVKDIDMNKFPLFNNWTPVNNFYGTLDGAGHWIFNLRLQSSSTTDLLALFQTLRGIVRNLNLEKANVSFPMRNSAVIAVILDNGIIENCYVNGNLSSTSASSSGTWGPVGIMVARMSTNSKIINCYVEGNLYLRSLTSGGCGGLVGIMESNSIIKNCYARISVTSSSSSASYGALVGNVTQNAQVINCFRDITVSGRAGSPGTGANQTTGTPLTTEQMKESMNFVSWDADYQEPIGDEALVKTWSIVNGYFPRLFHQVQNRMMMIETRDNTEITDIDFGYIVAGTDSAIREVTLRSRYLLDLGEIDIRWNRKPNISPYTKLRLSRTLEPFEDLETLRISGLELKFMEEIKFYVRVSTNVELEEGGAFDLNVRVTPN